MSPNPYETNNLLSLCITVIKDPQHYFLLRVADIEGDNSPSQPLIPFNPEASLYPEIATIGTSSMHATEENHNDLKIWEWKPLDDKKQLSYENPAKFYELLFSDEIDISNGEQLPLLITDDLINKLITGFTLTNKTSYEQNKKAFLVIGMTNNSYLSLLLPKGKMDNFLDRFSLEEGTYSVYEIPKDACIYTDDYVKKYPFFNLNIQQRIIYKERKLHNLIPISNAQIFLFTSDFKKYLKGLDNELSYTSQEKGLAEHLLIEIFENAQFESEFLQRHVKNGDGLILSPNMKERFVEAKEVLSNYFSKNKKKEEFVASIIENMPELREKYISSIKSNYLQDDLKQIEENIKNLNIEEDNIKKEINDLSFKKLSLEEEIYSIIQEKDKIENLKNQLDSFCNNKLNEIQNNPGALLGELAIYQGLLSKREFNPISSKNQIYIHSKDEVSQKELPELSSLSEFISLLKINLQKIGVCDELRNFIASYMVGAYLIKFPLILFGNTAELFADALSFTLSGQSAMIMTVPTGYQDYDSLIKTIQSQKCDVIVLRNCIGFSDESLFTSISKDINSKYILFSVDVSETIAYLPIGIYGYVGLIDCETLTECLEKLEFKAAKLGFISQREYNPEYYNIIFKQINELTHDANLTNGYKYRRAELICAITESEISENSLSPLIPELTTINLLQKNIEHYQDILDSLKNKTYLSIAEKFISGE